ncbi:hypothetical protein KAR52_01585 [Candidatus Pacearchaeota archaeon]|nr:hypothetical protein [Candidatus Pacearchaeota archaeon]
MENKKNIHAIINARGLARKLIDVDLNNKGASLQVPNLVKMKFDKYLNDGDDLNVLIMNDEYIARKATNFVHSSMHVPFQNSYLPQETKRDFSPKSFYDSCKRILSQEKRIGDCVGLSQIVKYLLDSKGLEVKAIPCKNHVALEVKIGDEFVPLETTVASGYGYPLNRENPKNVDLISFAACSSGIHLELQADDLYRAKGLKVAGDLYIESGKMYDKALMIDSKNSNAYYNRGRSLFKFGLYNQIVSDITNAIKINSDKPNGYYIRGISFAKLNRYDEALLDLKKYASFSESNALDVASTIKDIEEAKISNKKWDGNSV